MRVEKMTAPPPPVSGALPPSLSASSPQPLPPAMTALPNIPPLVTFGSPPTAHATLSIQTTGTPALHLSASHASTAPLPSSLHSQKLSYEQLLTHYQQVCGERDTLASQLEKLREKSLALVVDNSAAATAAISMMTPTPRLHHLTTFSPTGRTSPNAASASSSAAASAASALSPSAAGSTLQSLRDKHGLIQSTIGTIQHKTARILHDQERELIRAFRLRLTTLTAELDAERQRSASGSAEWVVRCKKLSEEMEWLRQLVEELGDDNKGLGKEVRRMKKAMRVQEEDRDFLIKQLVQMKKENAKLRTALDRGASIGAGLMSGNHLLLLGAGGQEAAAAIKEWSEECEEEKTAVS